MTIHDLLIAPEARLSARDRATLRAIERCCRESGGAGPSLRELAASLKLRNASTAWHRVQKLHARGLVTFRRGAGRRCRPNSLRLKEQGREELLWDTRK